MMTATAVGAVALAACGALLLAACGHSEAQSTMSYEPSAAPTRESPALAELPEHGTDDAERAFRSEPAPQVNDKGGNPPTRWDDQSTVSGIIDYAGATLVAHARRDLVVAFAEPGSDQIVALFDNPTDHGGPLVFKALTSPKSTPVDLQWIEVLLPVRPNGTTGWVRTSDVDVSVNPYRIEIDVDDFTLTVFRNNAPYLTTPVGIGQGQTPTPEGSFYLAELVRTGDPDGIYGPYAYGLSGFSEVLDSFAGGEGVIGLHGTNEPWAVGTNVSHGCVRVDNSVIEALVTFLPLGTPVDIGA